MTVIPVFQYNSSDFSQTIELDGKPYHLRMTWNSRIASWFLDILDKSLNDILVGIKVVPSLLLIRDYAYADLPSGDFMLLDTLSTPNDTALDFDSLGQRYKLVYITEAELEAAGL